MRQAEILNGLEAITELLYEVDAYDKEYSSQVIANAMEIICLLYTSPSPRD